MMRRTHLKRARIGSVAVAAMIPSHPMKKTAPDSVIEKRLLGLLFCLWASLFIPRPAQAQQGVKPYWDRDYGYEFDYPAGWALQEFPEGAANRDMRVLLQGPSGSSFMVVVEKLPKLFNRDEFEADPDKRETVKSLMQQTVTDVYAPVSRNLKASGMKVGSLTDLSTDFGIKFYISTLHTMKTGRSIIVAGIHEIPFSKNYRVDFIMTAFWDKGAEKQNEMLKAVFNSFHFIGEKTATSDLETPRK
ncbi:MAG: hypothetical protein ACM3TN_29075 [Alphaproteobacteria bacterium]